MHTGNVEARLDSPLAVVQAAWMAGAMGLDWEAERLDKAWNAVAGNASRTELADAAVELATVEGRTKSTMLPWDSSVCEALWQRLWAAGLGVEERGADGRHPLYEAAQHSFHPAATVTRYMVRHNGDAIPGELEETMAGEGERGRDPGSPGRAHRQRSWYGRSAQSTPHEQALRVRGSTGWEPPGKE